MRATRISVLFLGGICVVGMILLVGPSPAEAKGPGGPKGGPKKAPAAAKSGPKAKPVAKPGPKAKPAAKPAKAKRPVGRRPLSAKTFPGKRLPRRGTTSYLLPPIYLGQASPYFRPRLAIPRVIHSTTEHVSIVTATDASETTASVEGRPDLAVTQIQAEYDDRSDASEKQLQVTATIENLGGAAFRSDEGAQVLVLYKNGELVAQQDFDTLLIGQALRLTVDAEPEPVVYEARLIFADDLRQDGNPANDDMNPRNDSLVQQLDLKQFATSESSTGPVGSLN